MVKSEQVWSGLIAVQGTPTVGPAGVLYVDGASNAASVTISGSNPYKWTVTLPTLTAGQTVSMYVTATVDGAAKTAVVAEDIADTKLVSDLNDAAAAPSAADVGEEIWTGAYTRQINSVSGTVTANVVEINGETTPIDNLVLALGNSDGIVAHPQGIADAVGNLAPAGTPADGSIGDHLDDLATALAAATATLTVVSAVDGGELAIYQAVSFQATISGLAIPADWTKVYWTVKRATSEADTDAILQLVETNPGAGTDGLLRLNGAAGTAANGTLTVSQAAGTVVIDLVMTICDDLALATGLVWSLKALRPTSASTLLAIGTVNVLGQATAAVA